MTQSGHGPEQAFCALADPDRRAILRWLLWAEDEVDMDDDDAVDLTRLIAVLRDAGDGIDG